VNWLAGFACFRTRTTFPSAGPLPGNGIVPYGLSENCRGVQPALYLLYYPRLRGRQKSRPVDGILEEARRLIAAGVKELNLVAQDTTYYGHDLTEPVKFDTLLTRLAESAGDVWIRFLIRSPGEYYRRSR
jgi:hypothetical protein